MRLLLNKHRGQNLVEVVLTLPMLLLLVFGIVEVSRAWQVFQGIKLAALDGAYTASLSHDVNLGVEAVARRLEASNITYDPKDIQVEPIRKGRAYQVTVKAPYKPVFGGLSLPSPSGQMVSIIPGAFDITYTGVKAYAVY